MNLEPTTRRPEFLPPGDRPPIRITMDFYRPTRWEDAMRKVAGDSWIEAASDSDLWKGLAGGYLYCAA